MRTVVWMRVVIPLIAAVVLALDRYSKDWVIRHLALYETRIPVPAVGDFLRFTHTTNTGAAFGLLQGWGGLLTMVGLAVVVVILVYTRWLPLSHFAVRLGLGLQLGGALGNLVDRLRQGYVTDFLDMGLGDSRWWTGNVADCAIVAGVIVLGLAALLDKSQDGQQEPSQPLQAG